MWWIENEREREGDRVKRVRAKCLLNAVEFDSTKPNTLIMIKSTLTKTLQMVYDAWAFNMLHFIGWMLCVLIAVYVANVNIRVQI